MKKITIVCDSSADLPLDFMESNNIKFLPLLVDINGELYKDKIDITNEEFFNRIAEKDIMVKSSQVTPYVFEEFFRGEIEKGNEIICITISGKLSGTNSAANIAKANLEEDSHKVTVIDSLTASAGQGYLVTKAAEFREKGLSYSEIVGKIENIVSRMRTVITLDSVEMLKRGGRLSAGKALASSIMGIKPIITVNDGELEPCGKARGRKKSIKMVVEKLEEFKLDKEEKISVAHSNCLEDVHEFINMAKEKLGIDKFNIQEIGSAVGVYSGLGAIAVFCVEE
ncbi:MAG: DegV family protein [Clostridium sp.]|nr:DegV family protein [Clostridium sp.]